MSMLLNGEASHRDKGILDACCGSKMFYFDKEHAGTLFMDIRSEEDVVHGKKINVAPDIIADFRNMPFDDESFYLVVFDPPHLRWAGQNSFMKAQYGQLGENWRDDLAQGFAECWRVLKPNGTLVFKWSDAQINVRELLGIFPEAPVFGNQRGKTHWMVFYKFQQTRENV